MTRPGYWLCTAAMPYLYRGSCLADTICLLNAEPSAPILGALTGSRWKFRHWRVHRRGEVYLYRMVARPRVHDMLTIIRDRVQDMIKKSMTLEQIQAASPAQGYTRRFGSDTGPWTTRDFVAAVYKSLIGKK